MFRYNLIFIFRNFKRNKSSFFINLTGLSTGLACAILIYLWVNDELNFDKFHEKDSKLFQVMQNWKTSKSIDTFEGTPGPLPEAPVKQDCLGWPHLQHNAEPMYKDFFKWLILSLIISIPISYIMMNEWLNNFAYHMDISWTIFTGAGMMVLLTAGLTIGYQTIRAATANPVKSLRYE